MTNSSASKKRKLNEKLNKAIFNKVKAPIDFGVFKYKPFFLDK